MTTRHGTFLEEGHKMKLNDVSNRVIDLEDVKGIAKEPALVNENKLPREYVVNIYYKAGISSDLKYHTKEDAQKDIKRIIDGCDEIRKRKVESQINTAHE